MELLVTNPRPSNGIVHISQDTDAIETNATSTDKPFIQANTEDASLQQIRDNHIIPVFIKDNEPLISHFDFINTAMQVVAEVYSSEIVLSPSIRVSHPIKGRVPEAKNKPANELFEYEKTIYYERMAFIIEIPSVHDVIDGNTLSLTIGGLKAYNLDNLYGKKGNDEHFKVFIGFKNRVCTNLCVWTDGLMNDLKVSNIGQLKACMRLLIDNYNAVYHLNSLSKLAEYSLTETQFAQLIGRCRLYTHLPKNQQKEIPALQFGDNQISAICRDYYKDESFCRDANGNINLWRLYNLLTGVNKSSYIDGFIEKSVNAFCFTEQLRWALANKSSNWFLN